MYKEYSTKDPIQIPDEIVNKVLENHKKILHPKSSQSKYSWRVTKSPIVEPWSKDSVPADDIAHL